MDKCECGRTASYELYTGKTWQKHCKLCMDDAVDCALGAIIRRLGCVPNDQEKNK